MINSYFLKETYHFHAGVRPVLIPKGPDPVMVPHPWDEERTVDLYRR